MEASGCAFCKSISIYQQIVIRRGKWWRRPGRPCCRNGSLIQSAAIWNAYIETFPF